MGNVILITNKVFEYIYNFVTSKIEKKIVKISRNFVQFTGPCADGEQFRAHPKNPGPACIYWGETTDSLSRY